MTTAAEVRDWLAHGRGSNAEWVRADVPAERIAAVLAGMANASGGRVIVGVSPDTHRIQGILDEADALERILQATQLTDPPLVLPYPERVGIDDGHVLVLRVPTGLPQLHALDGRYLVRDGASTVPLSAPRLRRLLMERSEDDFERQSPAEALVEDLDRDECLSYLRALGVPPSANPWRSLMGRGCLHWDAGRYRPTYAGLLVFGRNPLRWVPHARVTVCRASRRTAGGRAAGQIVDGRLSEQLQTAVAIVEGWLQPGNRSPQRAFVGRAYPAGAIGELILNAMVHRDYRLPCDVRVTLYADRLEVYSPGGLPGPMTVESLGRKRYARNPILRQLMADLLGVPPWGRMGWRLADLNPHAHRAEPDVEDLPGGFRVTLRGALGRAELVPLGSRRKPLNPRQERALEFISRAGSITTSELQDLLPDARRDALRRDLTEMVAQGVLVKIGTRHSAYFVLSQTSRGDE